MKPTRRNVFLAREGGRERERKREKERETCALTYADMTRTYTDKPGDAML